MDIASIIHGIASRRGPARRSAGRAGPALGGADCAREGTGNARNEAINWDTNDTEDNLGDPCARNESAFLKRGRGEEERKKEKYR